MNNVSNIFEELVRRYAVADIKYPRLKPVTIAQWMLESNRGFSKLATEHLNFGGLKWKKEMDGYATKVWYQASDGWDHYCKFGSLEMFLTGYWKFIERSPYTGWKNHTLTGEDYIAFIGPTYCPSPHYVEKVLNLLPEARKLIEEIRNTSNRNEEFAT